MIDPILYTLTEWFEKKGWLNKLSCNFIKEGRHWYIDYVGGGVFEINYWQLGVVTVVYRGGLPNKRFVESLLKNIEWKPWLSVAKPNTLV